MQVEKDVEVVVQEVGGRYDVVEKVGGYVEHEVAEALVSREKAERIHDNHAAEIKAKSKGDNQ